MLDKNKRNTRGTNQNSGSPGNPAKSTYNKNNSRNKKSATKKGRKKEGENNKLSRKIGVVLSCILSLSGVIFAWALLTINMLPMSYTMGVLGVLFLLIGVIFFTQLRAKGKGIFGKILCVLLSISLGCGSFYLYQTHKMLASISGGSGLKIDQMVVVVRVDDIAETLEDAKTYNFGVQYTLNGEDVETAIAAIELELESNITTTELESISAQADALLNGEVDALIYNEAYQGIVEDEDATYTNQVKVIYTYDIETEIEVKTTEIDITKDPFAVYISGIDVYGSISKNSRSDVNILVYVNPTTKQVLLVNTPRDYYVTFPGVTGSSKDKLTHAGIYGVDTSMATLEQLYDTEVEYYARVNFTSLVTMVDALGGISVYSEQSFTSIHDGLVVTKGTNTFTGKEALAFCRERYNLSGGDNQRGRNQQAVITAMIQKVASPAIISGATGLISSVSGNVDTDMSQSDMQSLIKMQLSDGSSWNIKSIAATGTGDSQYCYSYSGKKLYVMQPNMSSVNQIKSVIEALENGEVLTDAMVAQ